ncbi:hypothetical protein GOAMR_20_00230 [Gordonia amarae NBRC 15530]|uniref:Uncharacterized protein n=2 Tax=Gordonia amarae TaxID=36821 RepID=G7GLK2_9ACTN|nr:hypothetical protein GOAMR_20_00230 [Gordonia amarae NBRC 15530]
MRGMRVNNTLLPATSSAARRRGSPARRIVAAVAVAAGLGGLLGGALTSPDAVAAPKTTPTQPTTKPTTKPVAKKKSKPIVRAWASHGRIYMSAINLPEGRKLCGITMQVARQYIGSYEPIKQLGDKTTTRRILTLSTPPLPPGTHTVSLRCYNADDGATIVASTRHVEIGFIEWAS